MEVDVVSAKKKNLQVVMCYSMLMNVDHSLDDISGHLHACRERVLLIIDDETMEVSTLLMEEKEMLVS